MTLKIWIEYLRVPRLELLLFKIVPIFSLLNDSLFLAYKEWED